jgi:GNAT superfamily N-acetyltransferase
MDCRHGNPIDVCRLACARCGHFCAVHRSDRPRGSDGVGCWECYERCLAWIEPAGAAVLDQGVELVVDDRLSADRRWTVTIRSWGQEAGTVLLAPGRGADEVLVERVLVKRAFRGKGIASEVYQELARLVAPLVLTSGIEQSQDAAALWAGQVAGGRAVEVRVAVIGTGTPGKLSHYRLEKPAPRPRGWPGAVGQVEARRARLEAANASPAADPKPDETSPNPTKPDEPAPPAAELPA